MKQSDWLNIAKNKNAVTWVVAFQHALQCKREVWVRNELGGICIYGRPHHD